MQLEYYITYIQIRSRWLGNTHGRFICHGNTDRVYRRDIGELSSMAN